MVIESSKKKQKRVWKRDEIKLRRKKKKEEKEPRRTVTIEVEGSRQEKTFHFVKSRNRKGGKKKVSVHQRRGNQDDTTEGKLKLR